MQIEELKSGWALFNKKIDSAAMLNQKLIESMIRERSGSRISKIRNESRLLLLLMVLESAFLIAILADNPFDFIYTWQYIPFLLLTIGALAAIWFITDNLRKFRGDLNKVDLAHFLRQTISAYDSNKRAHTWFVAILFSSGALSVVSFLPRKLESQELWPAIGETLMSIAVSVLIYYFAYRSGAFRSRNKPGFENDLKELNQLRALAADLNEPVRVL